MKLADPELPATRYLVGEHAIDVLRLPIEASGGVLESARPVHVQYRPGSDVVVRYSAHVSWRGAPPTRETLVAASAVHGTLPGAVPITADTPFGVVEVGVWRWPFDPVVPGIADIVTATGAAQVIGEGDPSSMHIEVAAYRPTDRAVIRIVRDGDVIAYVKAVAPQRATVIARRHDALRASGVPAPAVEHVDADRGLLVLEALHGPTLRDLVKADAAGWPVGEEFTRLGDAVAGADIDGPGPPTRLDDGVLHARMLAAVVPGASGLLEQLAARFLGAGPARVDGCVHGDLHEGQVVIGDGRIIGVLDVDDAGTGAQVDDAANVIARIRYRAVTSDEVRRDRLDAYADSLRTTFVARHDPARLDLHTAAALVGLATGPFRLQSDGWRDTVRELVVLADQLSMRGFSA